MAVSSHARVSLLRLSVKHTVHLTLTEAGQPQACTAARLGPMMVTRSLEATIWQAMEGFHRLTQAVTSRPPGAQRPVPLRGPNGLLRPFGWIPKATYERIARKVSIDAFRRGLVTANSFVEYDIDPERFRALTHEVSREVLGD